MPQPGDAKRRNLYLLLIMLGALLLMLSRDPFLLIHPRIWAEEGTYLDYALHHSVFKSVFYLYPASGYYMPFANVVATLSALIAKKCGLAYAPYVSTYCTLLIQCIPFALLAFGKSHLLHRMVMIPIASLLILLTPTTSGEIWLNTINAMGWIGIIALILVFEDTSLWSEKKKLFFRLLLGACAVSGPYACIMCPLFGLSYLVYREREKFIHALILLFGCAGQLLVFLIVRYAGGASSRLAHLTLDSGIVNFVFFFVATPLFGNTGARTLFAHLGMADSLEKATAVPRGGPVILAAYFCGLVLLLLLYVLWDKKLRSQRTLLIVCFTYLATFTVSASAYGVPLNRYAVLPGLTFVFLVFDCALHYRYTLGKVVCALLLICAVCNGIREYQLFWRAYAAISIPWDDEVQKWNADHNYQLHVWPTQFPVTVQYHPAHKSAS